MKTYEIANILQAEVINYFAYGINKNRFIVSAFMLVEPTEEQMEICDKYGFNVKKSKMYSCATGTDVVRDIWIIFHKNESEEDVVSVEYYLDAAIHTDRTTHESVVKALGQLLYLDNTAELALHVRDMEHEYMASPSDEPKSENYYELLIGKYASIIKEIYGKN